MKKCTIIGISDSREQWFPPEVMEIIAHGVVFSGGKRHHEIMMTQTSPLTDEPLLPANATWIDITVPLSEVFRQYEQYDDVVIFASGDPLFFGFANTVQRELPDCKIKVYPSFNSLQMLAHRMCLPYHDMHVVSLTGRPWQKFDEALINGEQLIGVLTDRTHTPDAILRRMLEYGYDNYMMTVGEDLGNEKNERITNVDVCHLSTLHSPLFTLHSSLNCLILQRTSVRPRPFGIPESDFALLNGRAKMITKMPIRLMSLSALDLRNRKTFWDVGFCTGSVSIEAKLQFPHLDITAFEIREEGRELMEENARRFGTPGITTVIGDFMEQDLSPYMDDTQPKSPRPDAIFIGGHGGRLKEMMHKVFPLLNDDGVIVMNTVIEASHEMFTEAAKELGMQLAQPVRVALDDFNPIIILKATKQLTW